MIKLFERSSESHVEFSQHPCILKQAVQFLWYEN